LAFDKVEPAGYITGPLYFISLAIGSRHSHLDAGAYSMDQKIFSSGGSLPSPEEAVKRIVEEEAWRQILSSLVLCFFARGIYKPDLVASILDGLGYELSEEELRKVGREIYFAKQRIKREEGFSAKSLRVPGRIYEVETPLGKIERSYVEKALAYFDELVGKGVLG
ncbi:MAG: aldehyde:ferredoxin oxidoreductase, partial [Thaumarchaeota archaeon]|nr:aldehyde:ferredoxin oxidoreductase [Nitrososphaerota archaeon]